MSAPRELQYSCSGPFGGQLERQVPEGPFLLGKFSYSPELGPMQMFFLKSQHVMDRIILQVCTHSSTMPRVQSRPATQPALNLRITTCIACRCWTTMVPGTHACTACEFMAMHRMMNNASKATLACCVLLSIYIYTNALVCKRSMLYHTASTSTGCCFSVLNMHVRTIQVS